jgi:hypothetical protein
MDLEKFFQWLSAILAAIWSFPVSTKKFIEINILEGIVDLIRDSFSMIPSRWAELVAKLLSDIVGFLKSLALYLHRGLIKGKAFSHLVELILPSTVSTAHMSYDDVLNGRTRPVSYYLLFRVPSTQVPPRVYVCPLLEYDFDLYHEIVI